MAVRLFGDHRVAVSQEFRNMFRSSEEIVAAIKAALAAMIVTALWGSAADAQPAPAPAKAKPRAPACVSELEAEAFRLRHFQSRLMVAGLSCGQRDAYNEFMTRHKAELSVYGPVLITYYRRTGGGESALNRYVTDLANAAASIRAENAQSYCNHTWNVFWQLQQEPFQLRTLAAVNPVPGISQPSLCPRLVSLPAPPQKKTAAPGQGAAAQ
jgi:hypothetical protein